MILTDDLNISYKIHMTLINMHHWVAARIWQPFSFLEHYFFVQQLHLLKWRYSWSFQFFSPEVLEFSPFETGKAWFFTRIFRSYFSKREATVDFHELRTAELDHRFVCMTCEKLSIWNQTVYGLYKGHPFINNTPYFRHLISSTPSLKRKCSSLKCSFAESSYL